jgi:predicted acyl esterase
VAIIQDCRGTTHSEGDVDFLIPEAEDGYDTLQWIDRQPWSNGKVGSWGTSWAAWTQTAMAALSPTNLAAMLPNMNGSNAHQSSVRHGGALELRFLAWAFWHSATNTQAALKSDPTVDAALNFDAPTFGDWLTRLPLRPGQTQLALVPAYERWALKLQTEADFTDYWRHPSLYPAGHWDQFPDAPVLWVGGWYDSYARATFECFSGLSSRKSSPVKVLVGPWTHGSTTPEASFAGDVEFGPAAALDSFRDLHLAWFDSALRGLGNGISDQPSVRIFVMGGGDGHRTPAGRLYHGGKWRSETEWPLERTQFTPFYITTAADGSGSLSTDFPPDDAGGTTYLFNPANPVPSIGGGVSSLTDLIPMPDGLTDVSRAPRSTRVRDVMSPGGFDQVEATRFYGCSEPYLPLGSRPDVLVFQTEPLDDAIELTGPITVKLWVSSSAPDTDFTAKLIDVYPPNPWYPAGYALNLTDSILRLRYRNGSEAPDFLEPREVSEITITLYPTSNLFAKGHRIRLDISSSNFPRFDVNPNTGEPIGKDRMKRVAENTVYHSAERPSHIVLPFVPIAE